MNKKTIILLAVLALLVFVALNRWDIKHYRDGGVQIRIDRLTTQTQFSVISESGYEARFTEYLAHGVTGFLYGIILVLKGEFRLELEMVAGFLPIILLIGIILLIVKLVNTDFRAGITATSYKNCHRPAAI